ncbi:TSUP family transporter [Mesorhizobium sp. ANAO-SY3R2]|uniref:TSUP family transporter n=1 Tax=Mesorhizobium sp. ANAO-SY3R2 TaxID=3166644 RepID=UPI00366D750D
MTVASLSGLLLLAGLAAYMQTLTGFALGLVMMGGIGLSGLMPLPEAAVLVSVLTLVNASQVLRKGWRDVAWPEFRIIIVASLIALFFGYWLLDLLAQASLDWLKLTLGTVIVVSSFQLAMRRELLSVKSSRSSFAFFGAIAGLMGGLFSTSGPPLVYHLYRQPLALVTIRETLVAVFAVNALVRLGIVGATGDLPDAGFWWVLLAVPAVAAATFAARRWPPPLSSLAMRRIAFALLLLSGLSLSLPAAVGIIAGFS